MLRFGWFCTYLALTLVGTSVAGAGEAFPAVTAAELALTEIPGQPGAPAVVLFSKARMKFADFPQDTSSSLEVQRRIKILTEEGLSYAEFGIGHDDFYRLTKVEGRTVQPDGRIVTLPKDAIFRDKVSRSQRAFVTKIAFPAVTVGAVIDVAYTQEWDSLTAVGPWQFQDRIPVLRSEITYVKPNSVGINHWSWETGQRKIQSAVQESKKRTELLAWMENLPAVPEEPFSPPLQDLSSRMLVLVTEVSFAGQRFPLSLDWEEVGEAGSTAYAKFRRKSGGVRKLATTLTAQVSSPRDKAAVLHAYVRDKILEEPWSSVLLREGTHADGCVEKHRGTAVEKALVLQEMLAAVGIDSRLVWSADRGRGRVEATLPSLHWFDRTLVRLELDGKTFYVDPADRRLAFGRLAPSYEGTQALALNEIPELITLPVTPFGENSQRAELALTVDVGGRVTGHGTLTLAGHHAWTRLAWKEDAAATVTAWKEWLEEAFPGHVVDGVEVVETVAEQQVKVSWSLAERPDVVLGDEVSLRLSRPLGPKLQPFILPPERRFTPVRFDFAGRDEVEVHVSWPPGWEVETLPSARRHANAVGEVEAEIEVDVPGRALHYGRRHHLVEREHLGREAYAALRDHFADLETSDAQTLVLVRP